MKNLNQLQTAVHDWVCHTFGAAVSYDKTERGHRFLEEALELVQSMDIPKEDVMKLVDYVYSRSPGTPRVEAGDVFLTLLALTCAYEFDANKVVDETLARAWQRSEAIRAKWKTKPKTGPLPGVAPEEYHYDFHRINRT